ncbi:MAG: DNA repair protein RecN [Bacteroidetes bacterium]|nr:DNA repair protein RecN [Bacteroidota bacterium]
MLKHLFIENYALIEKLDIDFADGFSIITGETGAGKSILLGALGLILGQRNDSQVLFDKNKKCIIEGTFYIKDYDLHNFFNSNQLDFEENTILRREINAQGKSRAFINDTPVNINLLKELGEGLVDIHSQHKTLALNNSEFQLAVVDNYAKNTDTLKNYQQEFKTYVLLKKEFEEVKEQEKQSKVDRDYYQFLFDELEASSLKIGEQSEIESELETLNHAEEIKSGLSKTSVSMSNGDLNLLSSISEIKNILTNLSKFNPEIKELQERINACYIELKDVSSEIEKLENEISYNPARIEEISLKLDNLIRLQQKHHVGTTEELLEVMNSISDKLLNINSLEEKIAKLQLEINRKIEILADLSEKLSKNRFQIVDSIENELQSLLVSLGMPNGQLKVEILPLSDFTLFGKDKVKFLFTANKGAEMNEVSKIASGGELSRLMLSIKSLISQRNLLPTIIFDEIDSGVSGEIAAKMGNIMNEMSASMQVIAITHLPQIAAKGKTHYFVYKETDDELTRSAIKKLNNEERVVEIAKMLSGEKMTETAVKAAKELLN